MGDDATTGDLERDPEVARRELRIERAVVGAVLHGYGRDRDGFNNASTDLLIRERAQLREIVPVLWWALSRLPRGAGDPEALRDHLIALAVVSDRPEP